MTFIGGAVCKFKKPGDQWGFGVLGFRILGFRVEVLGICFSGLWDFEF